MLYAYEMIYCVTLSQSWFLYFGGITELLVHLFPNDILVLNSSSSDDNISMIYILGINCKGVRLLLSRYDQIR